jgi:hypothetical protein
MAWTKLGNTQEDFLGVNLTDFLGMDYYQGNLYVAYNDINRHVVCKKWDGSTWSQVGSDVSRTAYEIGNIHIDKSTGYIYRLLSSI